MTCPNCYCTECQRERLKWTAPPVPYSVPSLPPSPFSPISPLLPPGWWACGCGMTHPPGFTCMQIRDDTGASGHLTTYTPPRGE